MKTEMYTWIENRRKTVLPSTEAFERWLAPERTAVVCIDMHRGHVGPEEELTLPAPRARARIAAHNTFHDSCRAIGIPIIMAQHWERSGGIDNAHSKARNRGIAPVHLYPLYLPPNPLQAQHSWEGTKWLDLMVETDETHDFYVRTKKRLSAFYPTDLEFLLRQLDIDNVVLTGTYTDACVLNTACDASNRDFRVIVPRDIVAGFSEEAENAALLIISLHFGLVVDSAALVAEWYARKGRDVPEEFREGDEPSVGRERSSRVTA